jgi:hypothetical protein
MPADSDEAKSRPERVPPPRQPARKPRPSVDDEWEEDERPRGQVRRDLPPDDGGVSTLIPYTNPKALVAYYFGVFGLIPGLGIFLAPVAVILGILGLRYAKAHPTAKGTGHAVVGIVLGSLSLVAHFGCIAFMVLGIIASNMK